MLDSQVIDRPVDRTDSTTSQSRLPRKCSGKVSAGLSMWLLLAACSSSQPADLESLGLAVAADVQAGERLDLTVAKDPSVGVTGVSAPSGVTATVSEPDERTLTLSVEVDASTPSGTYTVLLRTDRNGNGAELEWPFDVVDSDVGSAENEPPGSPDEVQRRFTAALYARDMAALQALWPEQSWDTIGIDVFKSFVPVRDVSACEAFDEGRIRCFVFDESGPWVLGLTMDGGPTGWTITSISLDSTN